MPEVDLTIVANNQQHLKAVLESKKAEEEFFATHAKGVENFNEGTKQMEDSFQEMTKKNQQNLNNHSKVYKEQVGYIEDITNSIKEWEEARSKSTNIKDIEKYNRKIAEGKKNLEEYNKAGIKVAEKQVDNYKKMRNGALKMFAAIGGGYAIIQGFNKLLKFSDTLGDAFEKTMQGAKSGVSYFFNALTTGNFSNFISGMKASIKAGKEYAETLNNIRDRRIALAFKEADAAVQYQKYRNILRNTNNTEEERREAAEKTIELEDKLSKERKDIAEDELKTLKGKISAERSLNEQQLMNFVQGNKEGMKVYEEASRMYVEQFAAIDKKILEDSKGNMNIYFRNIGFARDDFNKAHPFLKQANDDMKALRNLSDADKNALKDVYKEIQDSQAEYYSKIGRAERVQDLLDANKVKEDKKEQKEILKDKEEFNKMLEDLQKRYQDAQLEGLTGKARINAEEDFALLELANFKKTLEEKGKLTKEQLTMIEYIETSIAKKGVVERKKIDNEEKLNAAESKRGLIDTILANAEDEIDLTRATEEEKLELKIDAYQRAITLLEKMGDKESLLMAANLKKSLGLMFNELEDIKIDKEFDFEDNIWKALGIDIKNPEGQFQAKWIKEYANSVVESLGTILGAEAELAAQRRENAENRISELESQLDEELSLQEQGLANNVNAVKKELEQVKAEKQKAQEQEKQLQSAQMVLDTVSQISSLITASTNIMKVATKLLGPIGVPIGIAAIGTMFGFMAVAKVKAAQAAKMEQGGYIDEYGVIQGKRHSDGGEPLNKHVEVEQGEGVGVFNRNATQYYGGMLPKWVQSINNRNFPKFDIRPELKANQVFDLKTSSMNNKLDSINTEIRNLSYNILNQSQINHKQGVRVEKQGNRTRIVHEKD
jgi:hypothetical protein